ncbi:SGNH/GDSL hydrolase family protein [Rhodococcus opacus]|nr:SGNH/GDSL hydrolase family protein [Rhodococcus opacus]NKY69829.1 SGNH/GDSL hydrolase family protein [Rhodococcus opacus]
MKRDPKTIALVAFFVVAALLVGGGLLWNNQRAADSSGYVSSYTPPVTTPPVPAALVAVVGDSYTGGSDMGGVGSANWTSIVQWHMDEAKTPIRLEVSGQGGSGYVNAGSAKTVFPGEAARIVKSEDQIVVVFGSRNDTRQDIEAVRSAARATYSQIKVNAPNAKLIVIAPPSVNENVPRDIIALRDALKREADAAGAVFVDPIAEGWFFGDKAGLIGSDGLHPTDEGHAYMAGLIQPHIEAALKPSTPQ